MDGLYTTHDVSKLIHVDASTVSKWIDKGILTAYRTPGGHRRVRSSDLRAFLVAHQMPVPGELGSDRVHLLLLEDEARATEAFKRALRPFAAQVELIATPSVFDALLLVAELKPHGLLLDLTLPHVDAYEVCRAVRARPALESVRVVMLTGRSSADVLARSQKAGAVTCLAKPVDPETLLEVFRVPISLSSRAR